MSETRWWARKASAGHGAAEDEEGARSKGMQTHLQKDSFPGLLSLDANLTGLREAPEAAAAWLLSECLRILMEEADLSQCLS